MILKTIFLLSLNAKRFPYLILIFFCNISGYCYLAFDKNIPNIGSSISLTRKLIWVANSSLIKSS